MKVRSLMLAATGALLAPLVACADKAGAPEPAEKPFTAAEVAEFNEPWAMTFLPDGRLLVTEKRGKLQLFDPATQRSTEVSGVPAVAYGGQGGLGDVILHPQFATNRRIYISYAEEGEGNLRGAAVARATLELGGDTARLEDVEVIWRQVPKQSGEGHYGHRLAFGDDGMLWITSGDRQEFDPAQDMTSNLGKLVRLRDDGTPPEDNPFYEQGGVAAQIWSLGHRNPLGLAFDASGQLWMHEMGPRGGDELNLIRKGDNYGYPIASEGVHYSGKPFPATHAEKPRFTPPVHVWTPVISPAGFVIYDGELFPAWQGDGLIGGLSSEALVRVSFDGDTASEAARYDMGERIREVEQGPDGAVWLLEDGRNRTGGQLLRLTPASE